MHNRIRKELKSLGSPARAKILMGFFKTGKGQYGEGDIFLGITSSESRSVSKKYVHADLDVIEKLLSDRIHEHRSVALSILVEKFQKADEKDRKQIFDFYLKNTKNINNWDLVDISCHKIVGEYLLDKDRAVLYRLAKSSDLWEKRIAIVSTYAFISKNDFKDTLKISEILLNDRHDLIHKAAGWMLREVGKRDQTAEEEFLKKYCKTMPRTMLRYAIEKFDKKKKAFYMAK